MNPQLTKKGKRNLITLIVLGFVPVFYGLISLLWNPLFNFVLFVFFIVAPYIFFSALRIWLHGKMELKVLTHLGFVKASRKGLLRGYVLAEKATNIEIDEVYEGQMNEDRFKLIHFTVIFGRGDHSSEYDFIGLEFKTVKDNFPVQIIDRDNKMKWQFFGSRKLESNDFNETFKLFSKDPSHVFYQLDPDTMHDLLEIKKELGSQISMEMAGHDVLVYTRADTYSNLMKGRISFVEALNGDISPDDLAHYHQVIPLFLRNFERVFKLLDLLTQKVT